MPSVHTTKKKNPRDGGPCPAGSRKKTGGANNRSGHRRTKPARKHGNGDASHLNHDVKEAALDYLQQGWSVMRLPPRSKEPYKDKPWAGVYRQQ
jgi:hypothetical protein